jgi:tartrate-resistant acid phosphatase type 5
MKLTKIIIALLVASSVVKEKPAVTEVVDSEPLSPDLPQDSTFGVLFVGDTGMGDENQRLVAGGMNAFCLQNKCSVGLLLGDNFYPHGVSDTSDAQFQTKFEDIYKLLGFKFYPVLGNHDYGGNIWAQVDHESTHWKMGGEFYSISAGWIDLFALDTQQLKRSSKSPAQRRWLQDILPKSKATWKVVYAHHPVYSHGFHGNSHALKKFLAPLLESSDVDFYLSGHDHDKELISEGGVEYVVCGAGSKTRKIKRGQSTIFASDRLGFCHLLLSKESAVLSFLDETGSLEFQKVYPKAK